MTANDLTCCAASRDASYPSEDSSGVGSVSTDPTTADTTRMVRLTGGTFTMGTTDSVGFPEDGEGPARRVTLDPFYIDSYAVTNAEFLQFIRETSYTTDAERFGWSFVFEDFIEPADEKHVGQRVAQAPWWVAVEGAYWFRPDGPSSNVTDRLKHPVTHVSWRDARAYADWAGKRLPTEAEWEYAARGGLAQKRYAWGDEFRPEGEHRCNIWQGNFPEYNTENDGYLGTGPVNAYEPNGYGLYNVAGNVWEWCADWFSADYHTTDTYSHDNPTGPSDGESRVMRGGSYLCHRSYCNRYRVAARSQNTPESSTGNIGFRCVVDGDVTE